MRDTAVSRWKISPCLRKSQKPSDGRASTIASKHSKHSRIESSPCVRMRRLCVSAWNFEFSSQFSFRVALEKMSRAYICICIYACKVYRLVYILVHIEYKCSIHSGEKREWSNTYRGTRCTCSRLSQLTTRREKNLVIFSPSFFLWPGPLVMVPVRDKLNCEKKYEIQTHFVVYFRACVCVFPCFPWT